VTLWCGRAAGAEAWQAKPQPDLEKSLAAAKALKAEDVCTPVKSVRMDDIEWAPNPDGRTWDILQVYFPSYGGPNTIAIIDLGSNQVKTLTTERGLNFHLAPAVVAPTGKLYISILGSRLHQDMCIYDPATNEISLKALEMPKDLFGETHPMCLGTDGKIYCGGAHTSKAASACQIDPETNRITDYGALGPSHAPNGCWGYSVAADDRYVYIASGKIPWYLVAYDRQTKESKVLVTTERVGGQLSVQQGRYGCSASASKVVGTDGQTIRYWLYKGEAIPKKDPKEKPPWPEPENPQPHVKMPPKPEVSRARGVPDVDGNAEIWVRTPEAKAAAPKEPPPDAKPEDLGWQVFKFQVPTYPLGIYRVVELPDGRIFGTAGAYEGNFIYDPATGKSQHLGKTHLSHYATAMLDGKIYMSGYPTSPLYVYDPSQPWTAGTEIEPGKTLADTDKRSNPRQLQYLGHKDLAGTHKMYAAATGADGRVYFGGRWVRDGSAGGLAWWDPKAGKAGGFWEPFSNYQIGFMTTASGGELIVISTHAVSDSLLNKPKPAQGRLFVLDTATQKIVREIDPVENARGAGLVAGVGGDRVIGWTEDPKNGKASILYGVDVRTGEVAFRKALPCPLPVSIGSNQQEAFDFRLGPDGRVWTYMAGTLVRINPADGVIQPVGKFHPGRIAFAGRDIYLSGSSALRRVKGVVPK